MNIITNAKDFNFIYQCISIVPKEKIEEVILDAKWLSERVNSGAFYLKINVRYKLSWSYHKITGRDIKYFGVNDHEDVEVDHTTFLFLLKGLFTE